MVTHTWVCVCVCVCCRWISYIRTSLAALIWWMWMFKAVGQWPHGNTQYVHTNTHRRTQHIHYVVARNNNKKTIDFYFGVVNASLHNFQRRLFHSEIVEFVLLKRFASLFLRLVAISDLSGLWWFFKVFHSIENLISFTRIDKWDSDLDSTKWNR